ncbi:transferase family-domain-containing protein, partial [Pseudomassariella vexata]
LSFWNQAAPRVYVTVALCFPLDDNEAGNASQHLKSSLQSLAKECPLFAGRIEASDHPPGIALLRQASHYDIPFTSDYTEVAYDEVKSKGFPPRLFIDQEFGIPGTLEVQSGSLPVSRIHARFAKGGLLLVAYLHHSICDADCMRIFLQNFAARTRADAQPTEQVFGDSVFQGARGSDPRKFEDLIVACPEYTILPDCSGPTQPLFRANVTPVKDVERVGKIFVFTRSQTEKLQEHMRTQNSAAPPSTYTCLAALTFAHVVKARRQAEKPLFPEMQDNYEAMLWHSVNWRPRAFQDRAKEYYGNAALPAVTRVSMKNLEEIGDDVAKLVPLIKESIERIDQKHVQERLDMVSAAPDPRAIGVNHDPRMPGFLAFNTWRHFGADAEWKIPGVAVTTPDAIRRGHGDWNLGTALILPAKSNSNSQELFLSLSKDAMDLLCKDEGWMKWVD